MKTKICILTSVHQPFDGRIYYKQIRTLVKAGHEVTYIAQHSTDELRDGVRIIAAPVAKNRFQRMTKTVFSIAVKAIKVRADVYHFHDPELIPVGVILKLLGRKVIYDVHEHYPNSILSKHWLNSHVRRLVSAVFDIFERVSVPWLDFVIYTTPIVGERYKKMGVKNERIENYPIIALIPNKSRKKSKTIVYLGGITRIRGIIEVLRAFHNVVEMHPGWRLNLIGSITPRALKLEIENLIANLNLGESVEIYPWVPYDQKEAYFSQASIGVVTYLPFPNNMSCVPNKIFDYMVVGIPVVCSDFPLYKEIVEKSECGITVDPTDPGSIAKAIHFLIENPSVADEMGRNGIEAVKSMYNWEIEGRKLLSVYDSIFLQQREIQ